MTGAIAGAVNASLTRSLRGGEDADAEIQAACCSYPEVTRLVVVRDAHKVKSWEFIPDAAQACQAGGWLVAVSGDDDFGPRPEPGTKREPWPGVAAVRAAGGQAVRCVLPAASQEERVAWVQRRLPGVPATVAWEILARSGQHLPSAASACIKIRSAGLPVLSREVLSMVLSERPDGDIADLLALGRKDEALAAIPSLDPDDLGRLLGQLSSRLDLLVTLHEAVQADMSMADIRTKLRVDQYLAVRFRKAAGGYGQARVRRLRALLAALDAAVRTGAREGVAEALAVLW